MYCEILITTERGQVKAGRVSVKYGKVRVSARKGYERLMREVARTQPIKGNRRFRPEEGEDWLTALPFEYNGSYVRARVVNKS